MSQSRLIRRFALVLAGLASFLAIAASPGIASGPPVVNVEGVKDVSLNSLALYGTIDTNGASSASYSVEYGRTKLYGETTPSVPTAGSGVQPLLVYLVGLQPMSTYHYRISATSSAGSTTTPDTLFETLLSWKVAGKRISELGGPVKFEDEYKGSPTTEGGSAEIKGQLSIGINVRAYCRQNNKVSGMLGVQYSNLIFSSECKF